MGARTTEVFWRWLSGTARWLMLAVLLVAGVARGQLRLGELNFANTPALPLQDGHLVKGLAPHLASYSFVSAVGGVCFGGVAQPGPAVTGLQLGYLPEQPDGQRLRITLLSAKGDQAATAALYDWELVPIAHYAASEYGALFTMFGHLVDNADEQARRARGESILNYHPAIANTLLGLRIMQGDLLALRPDGCDLPTKDGKYLLGAGEGEPDLAASRRNWQVFAQTLQAIPKFQSYVVCDYRQEVTVTLRDGRAELGGMPYWYCWKDKLGGEARMEVQKKANDAANWFVRAECAQDQLTLPMATVEGKYNRANAQRRFQEIWNLLVGEALIEYLPGASMSISQTLAAPEVRGVNPTVYGALGKALRYAALFRYAKRTAPTEFANLLAALANVVPAPVVETPTVLIPPVGQPPPVPAPASGEATPARADAR